MIKKKIYRQLMMIDDNEDDTLLVREAFRNSDYFRLETVVHDGEEALTLLTGNGERGRGDAEVSPVLILLDINLPKMDGFDVLGKLKSNDRTRRIPVIILTTSSRNEDVVRAFELGANSVISKPPTPAGLRNLVTTFDRYWGETCCLPCPHPSG